MDEYRLRSNEFIMPTSPKQHWTHKLFVERPDLYLPFLEQAKERAPSEIEFLTEIFQRSGVPEERRLLDVACGTGRHSVPLAARGYKVTGADISPLFIDNAREYAQSEGVTARFVVADALRGASLLERYGPFDAIINMFTSHGYYGRDDDFELFRHLRRLAVRDAILVVLTINRDWLMRNFEPEGLEKAGRVRILQRRQLDLETSSVRTDWEFFTGHGKALRLELKISMEHRIYSLHELKELLERAGWAYIEGLGKQEEDSTQLGPLTYDSNAMWIVARAA